MTDDPHRPRPDLSADRTFTGITGVMVDPVPDQEAVDRTFDYDHDYDPGKTEQHLWEQAAADATTVIGHLVTLVHGGTAVPFDPDRAVAVFGADLGVDQLRYVEDLCGILAGEAVQLRHLHAAIPAEQWDQSTEPGQPWVGVGHEFAPVLADRLDDLARALTGTVGLDLPPVLQEADRLRDQPRQDATALAALIDDYAAHETFPRLIAPHLPPERVPALLAGLAQRITPTIDRLPHLVEALPVDRVAVLATLAPLPAWRAGTIPERPVEPEFGVFDRSARKLLAQLLHPVWQLSSATPAQLAQAAPVRRLVAMHHARPDYAAGLPPAMAGLLRHLAALTPERPMPTPVGAAPRRVDEMQRKSALPGLQPPGTAGVRHISTAPGHGARGLAR
ncbi:hypothetical protein ALI22I_20200 [Saccharothrix sp. ALI-22-I]|uniref:hypothetical protein n=1 Tax=Saccharothrix sp. ALI-22-I TaxID=1933778 RepID=UPI00097C2E37|nr:hypothetical protein [Saccharothrix sp. ALI-22-I]ONI88065.1 hypothetical protein ALI22I_20200 [Saccharothrix sp. ALI-22-I]